MLNMGQISDTTGGWAAGENHTLFCDHLTLKREIGEVPLPPHRR